MAKELTARLGALGRAHDLVRPLPGHQGRAALLGDLISVLLSPYDDTAAFSGRIRVAVPRMGIGERAATALALVLHELATNSLKYGALSADTGSLDISGAIEDDKVCLAWTERGGPTVELPSTGEGYGSKLLVRSVTGLGGTISTDWSNEGIVVALKLNAETMAN